MRRNYILSPEADSRIRESELWKRIDEYCEGDHENKLSLTNIHLSASDFKSFAQELWERGYFKTLVWETRKRYFSVMNLIIWQQIEQYWRVNRNWSERQIVSELDDLLIFSWIYPAEIMNPNELWNHERVGFSSVTDLVSAVSVYMINLLSSSPYQWRKWLTKKDWRTFSSVISWDSNWDFCLVRNELTPHDTINPFWDISSVRPTEQQDRQWLFVFHSNEIPFLVIILKWMEQCWINSKLLNSWFDWILDFLRTTENIPNPFWASCTEQSLRQIDVFSDISQASLSKQYPSSVTHSFGSLDSPLLHFWFDPKRWVDSLITMSGNLKVAQLRWDNLVFTAFSNKEFKPDNKTIYCELYKEEIDDILKWLLVQAYKWLWRTNLIDVLSAFAYYFANREKLLRGQLVI